MRILDDKVKCTRIVLDSTSGLYKST